MASIVIRHKPKPLNRYKRRRPYPRGTPIAGAAVNVVLDDATLSATADHPVQGSLTKTTANATLSAHGRPIVAATVGITAEDATCTATVVTILVQSQVHATLADATLSATVEPIVKASMTKTTANAALFATGNHEVSGTVNVTLADAALSASMKTEDDINADVAVTLANATLAATVKPLVQSHVTATLDSATLSAHMSLSPVNASVDVTLDDATHLGEIDVIVIAGLKLNTVLQNATLVAVLQHSILIPDDAQLIIGTASLKQVLIGVGTFRQTLEGSNLMAQDLRFAIGENWQWRLKLDLPDGVDPLSCTVKWVAISPDTETSIEVASGSGASITSDGYAVFNIIPADQTDVVAAFNGGVKRFSHETRITLPNGTITKQGQGSFNLNPSPFAFVDPP